METSTKGLPEKQKWLLLFLGYYAGQKISNREKEITTTHLCSDERRIPTVRRHLESLGLIVRGWGKNLTPIDEKVEELLPEQAKEPQFNTSGFIEKSSAYSHEEKTYHAIMNRGEVYRDIDKLTAEEHIYVYLHQDEYEIENFTTKHAVNYAYGSSNREYHSIKLFPIKLIPEIQSNILVAQSKQYAAKHAKEILTHLFKCKFRAINDEKPYLSLAEVHHRENEVTGKIKELNRVLKELKVIQRRIKKEGDEKFSKAVWDSSYDYLLRQAPLWIVEETQLWDSQKALAQLLLKEDASLVTTIIHR